jgi:hypothetical protein
MKNVVLHNSYESFHNCLTVRTWVKSAWDKGGRVTYPETSSSLRFDDSFRNRVYENRHDRNKERSSIEKILPDMISNVPLYAIELPWLYEKTYFSMGKGRI